MNVALVAGERTSACRAGETSPETSLRLLHLWGRSADCDHDHAAWLIVGYEVARGGHSSGLSRQVQRTVAVPFKFYLTLGEPLRTMEPACEQRSDRAGARPIGCRV